jgi:hypothetical protein
MAESAKQIKNSKVAEESTKAFRKHWLLVPPLFESKHEAIKGYGVTSCDEEDGNMGGKSILGIALIVLGIIALAYQGFSYTVPKKAVDVGPIHVTRDEKHTVPLPPILGALALIGGIAVLAMDRRDR